MEVREDAEECTQEYREEQFFCDCGEKVVLPPSGKDYFELFGW